MSALAAATAGDTRYTGPGAPMRRSKLRLVVLAVVSPAAGMPGPLPMHEPQPGAVTKAPERVKRSKMPSCCAAAYTASLEGVTVRRTPAANGLPASTASAARKSASEPPVHDAITTL